MASRLYRLNKEINHISALPTLSNAVVVLKSRWARLMFRTARFAIKGFRSHCKQSHCRANSPICKFQSRSDTLARERLSPSIKASEVNASRANSPSCIPIRSDTLARERPSRFGSWRSARAFSGRSRLGGGRRRTTSRSTRPTRYVKGGVHGRLRSDVRKPTSKQRPHFVCRQDLSSAVFLSATIWPDRRFHGRRMPTQLHRPLQGGGNFLQEAIEKI